MEQQAKIYVSGVKSLERSHFPLAQRTLITGPMGSGKSAILGAIQFCFTGRWAAIGLSDSGTQSPAVLRQIFRDGGGVRLHLPPYGIIERRVEHTPASARVKTRYWPKGTEGDEFQDSAADELIARVAPSITALDFGAFLAMTAPRRRDTILEMIEMADTDANLWARAGALFALDCFVRGVRPDYSRLKPDLADGLERALASADLPQEIIDLLDAEVPLSARLEGLKEGALKAEREKAAKTKVIEGLTQTTTEGVPIDPAELDKLRSQVENLDAEIARFQVIARRREEAERTRQSLEKLLESSEARVLDIRASIIPEAEKQRLLAERDGLQSEANAIASSTAGPDDATEAISARITEVALEAAAIAEKYAERRRVWQATASGTCPTCERPWDVAQRRHAEAEAEMRTLIERHKAAKQRLADLKNHLEAEKRKRAAWLDKARSQRIRLNEINDRISQISRRLAQSDEAERDLPAAEQAARDIRTQLSALEIPEKADADYLESLKAQRENLAAKLESARKAAARAEIVRGADLDKLDRTARIWKAAAQGAAAGRTHYLNAQIAVSVASLRSNVRALGIGDDAVIDLQGKQPHIAVIRGGKTVTIDAMSRGQQVLFGVALAAALPATRGKARIVTLEAIEAYDHAETLLRFLADAPIQYCFVAMQNAPIVAGWNRIELN